MSKPHTPESSPFGPGIKVAVIGAGVSGICTAAHLLKHGVDVTVFERSGQLGGVWNFQEQPPASPSYPSERPSVSETKTALPNQAASDVSSNETKDKEHTYSFDNRDRKDLELAFAPPSPCYAGLTTNVPTTLMYSSLKHWPKDAQEFVKHTAVKNYLSDLSLQTGVNSIIQYWTRVESVVKAENGKGWHIKTATLKTVENSLRLVERTWHFDAVVVASGHYNLPRVPDFPGLSSLKQRFPDRIIHSKEYRRADAFSGKNVLVIGGGVSALDVGRELAGIAKSVIQSTRSGKFDIPESLIPDTIRRVGGIARFSARPEGPKSNSLHASDPIPATVVLEDGSELENIDHIVLATGYLFSFPFLSQFHTDETPAETMDEKMLVGANGNMVHNLYKDIFYTEDPSLAFVGLPYHIVTFSTFDYQAQLIARVFSGLSRLPPHDVLRSEYKNRVKTRGFGIKFHSQMEGEREIEYVTDLVRLAAGSSGGGQTQPLRGHSEQWLKAYHAFKAGLQGLVASQAKSKL